MAAPQCPNVALKAEWEAKKTEAEEERDRCDEAIPYFEEYKTLATACREVLIGMRNKNARISEQCEQIIIDGKRIDNGRYYTEGRNSTYFTSQLTGIIVGLYDLIGEITRVVELLKESREKAVSDIETAEANIEKYSKPCGVCYVCNPAAYAPTATPTTPTSNPPTRRTPGGRGGPQIMTE